MDDITLSRFTAKVQILPNGCWRWTGALTGTGYGNFAIDARRASRRWALAHVAAYTHWIGPIPDGMQLDHRCRHRWCCNPEHVEPVTNRENSQRGARGRLVTTCRHGHPYDEANTGWHKRSTGARRYCKTCAREQQRARYVPKPEPTHCRNGHDYTITGRRRDGSCAECARQAWRRWRARN